MEERVVPTLLGQSLFPADYPTNAAITNAPVSANSATWVGQMAATRSKLFVDWGAYTPGSGGALYSMPYNIVHSKDTVNYSMVKVYIDNYPGESDLTGTDPSQGNRPYALVPMPKVNPQNLFIEGDGQNGADATRFSGGGSDSHLIVWDADTNTAYEMWEASRPSESASVPSGYYINSAIANQWNAANDAIWKMSTDSFRTLGYTSADAAGLPILNNIVRPDEVLPAADGGQSATPVIDHALRFTLPRSLISKQFTFPASHVAAGTGGIPYGQRFRLKNDAATNALIAQMGPESQVIARALQQYGLILADIGSSMFVQGAATSVDTNNNPIIDPKTSKPITWNLNDLMPDKVSGTYKVGLDSIPTSSFEAVDLTPKVTSLSASSGPAGTTITVTGSNFNGAAGHLSVLFVPPGNNPPYTSNGTVTTLNPGVVVASSVTIVDDQHLQVLVPSGTGTVDIRVLSGQLLNDTYNGDKENATAPIFGYGLSPVSTSDQFSYTTGNVAPSITTQPSNRTVVAGATATFTAAASGSPVPTVQWQLSTDAGSTWANISGATATSYSVTNTTAGQSGYEYRAVFTNTAGTATTSTATLTVNVAPGITTQPVNQTVLAGATATFTAAAGGSPPPTVQWQLSTNGGSTWADISGATATSYSVVNTTVSQNGYQYHAVFTNTAGSATSSAAILTVNAAPAITTQPANQSVTAGATATFTAAASGSPAPTVQWQLSTDAGSTWANISGATATSYSVTNTTVGQSGYQYRAVFTNTAGTATTSPATLTVSASSSTTATFINADGTTQGSWKGAYGADGYSLSQGASSIPSYATVALSGQSNWVWASSTTDPRALQQPGTTSRLAACWYASTSFTIDVNLTDKQTHQIALSALDWDSYGPRQERIDVIDPGTAKVLDTRTVTNFSGGQDLVWNVSGHVQFKVTNLVAGRNAVISGIFFAPITPVVTTQPANQRVVVGTTATFTAAASGSPSPTVQWQQSTNGGSTWANISGATTSSYSVVNTTISQNGYQYRAVFTNSVGTVTSNAAILTVNPASSTTATFVKADGTTQGSWQGTYGADGYSLSQGASSIPAYATVALTGQSSWVWASSTTDPRALQQPGTTSRLAACWYASTSFTIDVNLTDGLTHQVALSALDWDSYGPRQERIDVIDPSTGKVLDSRTVTSFSGGQYLVWNVSGHVQFKVTNLVAGRNAVISGIFFGPKV